MPTKKNDWPKGLQKKGSGWYQTFYDKQRKPTTKWIRLKASTLSRALIERGRVIAEYESGAFDPWQAETDDLTLREAVAAYLASKASLAKNTRKTTRVALNTFLAHAATKTRPDQITPDDVRRFIERPGLKETTRSRRLDELATFFKWCCRQKYIGDNPALAYKAVRKEGLSRYARQQTRQRQRPAIMPEALRSLVSVLQLAAGDGSRAAPRHFLMMDLILFAAGSGLRRSEICYLNRRDIKLAAVATSAAAFPTTGRALVRNWDDPRTGENFRTKNGVDRTVALTPLACQIAARHLAAVETEDDYAPVFRSLRFGRRINPAQVTVWFAEYHAAANLAEGVVFHSLRHSFASWLLMLGVNVLLVQRLMGHASLAQLDEYAKIAERFLLGEARDVQRAIVGLLCPGLSPALLDHLLPTTLSFAETYRSGRYQRRAGAIPIEDALFAGAAYQIESTLVTDASANRTGFLETF